MKTIRTGVIGVGYLGRFHAHKYAAMEGVELVGVADPDDKRAQLVAGECTCRAFADAAGLLQHGVDAVSVVAPTSLHYDIGTYCLQAGIDVLMEKPITVTLAEADGLLNLAQAHGCILQVGHLERFNPAVLTMEPLLTHPLFIEAHRLAVFKDRGTDVDVVLDLMIHDIDLILAMVNAPLETIHTVGAPVITGLTDIANARLIFTNGCTANVTASRISMDNSRRLRIFQPGHYISLDFAKKEVMTVQMQQLENGTIPQPDIHRHRVQDQDALELEIRDFVTAVRTRNPPRVPGQAGRQALALALQIVEQINLHRGRVEESLHQSARGVAPFPASS
ncbi:MAG: UDP-N-acetyl-D-glucosamine dehydrogenase [Deltaproteobacteria bacterium]|nr:MAG: UDP-N-acetyl-D-glucosamine dehydrogenase [Deltaproteobacteria bacterium]